MTEAMIFDTLRQALWIAVVISVPILSVALLAGIAVGLFQALTSIQEMTLTFVPKLIAILIVFWVSMDFMTRTLTGSVADGGRLLLRESLVLGRHGQRGGALTSRVRLTHAGRAAVAEDLDLRDTGDLPAPGDGCGPHGACATRDLPGVLRGHRVLDQVLALGWTPPTGPDAEEASGATRLELARPGTLARWSGVAGHDSPIGDLAEAWGRTMGVTSS